jgi:hypothetical protein
MNALSDGMVTLRRFRDGDVTPITAACADPDIARFIPGMPVPYTEDDARTYLANLAEAWRAEERRPHIRFREGRRDSVLFSLLPSDVVGSGLGLAFWPDPKFGSDRTV